jgi:hypothetical protein
VHGGYISCFCGVPYRTGTGFLRPLVTWLEDELSLGPGVSRAEARRP